MYTERWSWDTALILGLAALAVLQLIPFLTGHHLTADDVLFQYWALTKSPSGWIATGWDTALFKAKIGEAFSIPVMVLGNAAIDTMAMRAMNLGVFAASVVAFALYLRRLFGPSLALTFGLVVVAATPLRFFNMPPTSYPLFPSLQIIVLLVSMLAIDRPGPAGRVAAAAVCLAMISSEYTLLFGAALVLFELGRTAVRTDTSRISLLFDRRAVALVCAIIVHVIYRELIGHGDYTAASGWSDPGQILAVVVNHAGNGTIFGPASVATDWSNAGLAGFALAAAVGSGGALLVAAMARRLAAPRPRLMEVLAFAVLLALALTVPIALMEKYRDWCVAPTRCAYIESRYAGWAILTLVAAGLQHALATRYKAVLAAAMVVGLTTGLTAGHNAAVAEKMRAHLGPWRAAEAARCGGNNAWRDFLVSPTAESIPFHITESRTRTDYWRAWGERITCETPARSPSA